MNRLCYTNTILARKNKKKLENDPFSCQKQIMVLKLGFWIFSIMFLMAVRALVISGGGGFPSSLF